MRVHTNRLYQFIISQIQFNVSTKLQNNCSHGSWLCIALYSYTWPAPMYTHSRIRTHIRYKHAKYTKQRTTVARPVFSRKITLHTTRTTLSQHKITLDYVLLSVNQICGINSMIYGFGPLSPPPPLSLSQWPVRLQTGAHTKLW